jgi:hypothetical protein
MFPRILRREILLLLALKAILLCVLYAVFFSPSHRLSLTPELLRSHVLGTNAPGGHE